MEVSVPATGARSSGATVSAVVPSVDGGTSRVPVEIDVPNGDGRFLPHAFARVRLASGRARDALRVPAAAVFQREGAFALWIAGADGKAAALPVRVLAQGADAAVVEVDPPGLPRGARVVALPPLGLVEGQLLAEATVRPRAGAPDAERAVPGEGGARTVSSDGGPRTVSNDGEPRAVSNDGEPRTGSRTVPNEAGSQAAR